MDEIPLENGVKCMLIVDYRGLKLKAFDINEILNPDSLYAG